MDQQRAETQTSYDRIADEYARQIYGELAGKPLDRAILDRFAERLRGRGAVCDMGCGPGQIGRYLADRGLTEGWENPERSVEEAAKLLRRNIDASGGDVRGGVRRYNGSGPAAEAYADDVMRRWGATPMPEDATRAAHVSRPDPVSVGSLSGEMTLALDLTPDARRLLQGPQVPMSTRFGSSRPFGAMG